MTRHSTINTKRCDILYRQPGSNSTWPRHASGLFREIDELTSLFLHPHLVYAWSRTDEAEGGETRSGPDTHLRIGVRPKFCGLLALCRSGLTF